MLLNLDSHLRATAQGDKCTAVGALVGSVLLFVLKSISMFFWAVILVCVSAIDNPVRSKQRELMAAEVTAQGMIFFGKVVLSASAGILSRKSACAHRF